MPSIKNKKCELCGMTAVHEFKDPYGVTHYYCEHHMPVAQRQGHPAHKTAHEMPTNHNKHAGHSVEMFRRRFWISLLLTIPVLLYSEMIQEFLRFKMPAFTFSNLTPFLFGTAIFFYGGAVFIKSAYSELKSRQPGMMTLISLAIITAYAYSLSTVFFIQGSDFFWELATLITVMLLGHWMEMKSVSNAQGALRELAKLLPDTAELASGKIVPVSELSVEDVVLVRPGGKIPADGKVVEGESEVNESMITGESKPVEKINGSEVIAGTVNGNGSLQIKVAKIGEATALAGIMRLIAEAQGSRSKAQILADRAAFYLTLIAILSGISTLSGWLIVGAGIGFAMARTVTVLVIACPHALGLAIPLVTSISTSLGAKNGLLVRQRMALESARNIDVVLFDKTGTLTRGEHGVIDIWPEQNYSEDVLLSLAASVESKSEHIIGRAIVNKAKEKNIKLHDVQNFSALPGQGVQGAINERSIMAGGPQLLRIKKLSINEELQSKINRAGQEGKTIIYVFADENFVGAITLADMIREESKQAIKELQGMGVRVSMLTGDSRDVAASVAGQLGIKEYFAEVLPEHKANKVKELQEKDARVAMVGDGVNDAPALTQADLGIAIGAGTDVAIESAGIILVKNDPRDVVKIIKLSRGTYRKMVENLLWATGYNVIAIPLAAGALSRFGIILAPAVGALLMSASTVIVALNAQLLRRQKL